MLVLVIVVAVTREIKRKVVGETAIASSSARPAVVCRDHYFTYIYIYIYIYFFLFCIYLLYIYIYVCVCIKYIICTFLYVHIYFCSTPSGYSMIASATTFPGKGRMHLHFCIAESKPFASQTRKSRTLKPQSKLRPLIQSYELSIQTIKPC